MAGDENDVELRTSSYRRVRLCYQTQILFVSYNKERWCELNIKIYGFIVQPELEYKNIGIGD